MREKENRMEEKERKKSRKQRKKKKSQQVKLPRVNSENHRNWAQAQLIWTPKPTSKIDMNTIKAQVQAQSLWAFTIHCSQAQSDLGPEESKAQLKWAPATSKDGSDYDPPSPVTNS